MSLNLEEERALIPVRYQPLEISQKDLDMYKNHFCMGVSDEDWQIFIQKCGLYGLNPMLNEIFLVGRNTKKKYKENGCWVEKYVMTYTTQVALTGLINLARRTKEYEGYSTPEYFDQDMNQYQIWSTKLGPYPYAIRVGAFRRGNRQAALIPTYFHERAQYFDKEKTQLTYQWQQQGIHMHLKCAVAAAVRWEFTEVCGGIYIHEEMPAIDPTTHVVPNPEVVEAEQPGSVPDNLKKENPSQRHYAGAQPLSQQIDDLKKRATNYQLKWEDVLQKMREQNANLPEEELSDLFFMTHASWLKAAETALRSLARETRDQQKAASGKDAKQVTQAEKEARLAELKNEAKSKVPAGWPVVIDQLAATSGNLARIKESQRFIPEKLLLNHLEQIEQIIARLAKQAEEQAATRTTAQEIKTAKQLLA